MFAVFWRLGHDGNGNYYLILKLQKLRFGDVRQLAKGYSDSKSWSRDSNSEAGDAKAGVSFQSQDPGEGQAGRF